MSIQHPVPTAPSGRVLLLGGPPGSGKSTVAEATAAAAARPTVHLHADAFHVWIRSGFVPPYLPAAAHQNEVVGAVTIDAARAYAAGGYDVIVDGIVGPWSLDPFRAACRRDGLDLSYAVLRPSLAVTLDRATRRTGGQLTDPEPITGLYRAFQDLGRLERHVIDSSGQDVEETAAVLTAGLRAGRFVLGA